MSLRRSLAFSGFLIAAVSASTLAAQEEPGTAVRVNHEQVKAWNTFADNLYRLHQKQLDGRAIRQTETTGGYARLPKFYREVSYFDAANGKLLSRIQWERDKPQQIHGIEVFVYDDQGRVARDYMAWYLPAQRHAPRATTINLHHYSDGLHGWRQFDASGERIYERCTKQGSDAVVLEFQDDVRIEQAASNPRSVMHGPEYRRCFGNLQKTAGRYLTPQ